MSTPNTQEGRDEVQDFVLANVDGKFLRFKSIDAVPEGHETLTLDTLEKMTKDDIGRLYGTIAGVNPKNFKDKKVAIESFVYQVTKMNIFDPSSPKATHAAATSSSTTQDSRVKKTAENFELLAPPDVDKALKSLAPQARELVLIMTELAKEKGSTKFAGTDLADKLKQPEVAARLKTKQDPARILQYYKGKLIGHGIIRTS